MKLKSRKTFVARQRGQAVVEYVILVVVVALAALLVLTAFSDRIRTMIAGVTTTLGGEQQDPKKSMDIVKELNSEGLEE